MKSTNLVLVASAIAAAVAAVPAASAQSLTGNQVGVQYYFPAQGDLYADYGGNLVGTDPATQVLDGVLQVGFGSTNILFESNINASFTPSSFNGLRLYDLNGTIASFTGVTLGSSNFAGFDASRISFDADNIYLNFQGLGIAEDTFANLNIGFNTVPEPATWAMMILGVALIGGAMRNRQQAKVRFAF